MEQYFCSAHDKGLKGHKENLKISILVKSVKSFIFSVFAQFCSDEFIFNPFFMLQGTLTHSRSFPKLGYCVSFHCQFQNTRSPKSVKICPDQS